VNGVVVSELGTRADPVGDVIAVDGERLAKRQPSRTIVLHKPRGVVSTLSDPEGRPTVRELVAGAGGRLYPVGRLDLQSSGLLLLTDDGALADKLLHPRRGIERVYHVKVHGPPDGRVLGRLRRGVRLDDGLAVPTRVRLLESLPRKAWLEITVREGRTRLVRRMCASLGLLVDKLERVRLGPITLGDLPPGAWRPLTTGELAALRRAARLRRPVVAGEAGKGGRPRGRGTPPRTPPPPRGRRSPPGGRGAGSAGPPAARRRDRRPRPAPEGA
jgi:23S rRNA pseudouridine2605 synthase